MSGTKQIIQVTEDHKNRVQKISDSSDTTIKETTKAILEWALPNFEEGGIYQVNSAIVTEKVNPKGGK